MVLRLRLERPISSPVLTPQGRHFRLEVGLGFSLSATVLWDEQVFLRTGPPRWVEDMGPEIPDGSS